jgi:hypothetical protein
MRLLLVVIALLAAFLAIVLHELGHLLGGRLAGFRFALLVVGPLRVSRSAEGLQWGWNTALGLAGGLAASLPTAGCNLRRGILLTVTGGPLTSLVVGLGALALFNQISPATVPATFLYVSLLALSLTSLLITLATLIPHTAGGFYSDGQRLLALLRRDPEAEQINLTLLVSAAAVAGVRPRAWDAEQMARIATLQNPTAVTAVAASLLYTHALDRGDLPEARRQLQRMLDYNHLLPPATQNEALYEAVFFEAWHRRDAAQAARFLPATQKDGLGEPAMRLKAQTAVALLHGEDDRAWELLQEAQTALQRSISPGTAVLTAEQLAAMADRLSA